ncbi:MAG: RNA 3'-terminal phosphate cyclase [Theionarchaea archaeon]|nr:RNA 3'-terminal phosphate cyclase [Theionarchaea archaeon]
MLLIDGRHGEGGGQILRTSIALSALTNTPCTITHIRAHRPTPGLKSQHLMGLKAAAQICNARTKGAHIQSERVEFTPGSITGGIYTIDIGTAGSITLILQVLIPICLHAPDPVTLHITGGTDVKWSPTIAYFQNVVCSHLEQMGARVDISVDQYGFYPKGGGRVRAKIFPWKTKNRITIRKRGDIERILLYSVASSSLKKPKVAERQATACEKIFVPYDTDSHIQYAETLNPGSSICVVADCEHTVLGADALGARGKPAERVGDEAAVSLQKELESGYVLDSHMADQIVPYLALAGGSVTVSEITEHTRTNIWACNQFCKGQLTAKDHTLKTE